MGVVLLTDSDVRNVGAAAAAGRATPTRSASASMVASPPPIRRAVRLRVARDDRSTSRPPKRLAACPRAAPAAYPTNGTNDLLRTHRSNGPAWRSGATPGRAGHASARVRPQAGRRAADDVTDVRPH